jgi:hypothetical integral membrane protein (TIGR02206 family)
VPTTFAPYTLLHALVLVVCALLIAAPALLGRALSEDRELILRRALAVFAVVYWFAYNIWWNWHGLDMREGLPLHLCDIGGLIAPLALLTGWRWARAPLYFWTATLTLQAFIQPELKVGPTHLLFWAFWTGHSIIAACAVYDIAVLGFRPGWPDLWRATVLGLIYAALIIPIDLWLGADYGYIGNPPPDIRIPPFVDALGPWPLRAVLVVLLAIIGFVVVLVPWRVAPLWRRRPRDKRTSVGGA